MITRYLIKVTYLEGIRKGKSYLLRKGGFVTDDNCYEWKDTTYASKGIAERICRMKEADNNLMRKIEREDEERRIKRGCAPTSFYVYELQSFEPYPVQVSEE